MLVEKLHPDHLEARWEGPYTMVLSTPTAEKVAGKRHWIHHTRLEKFAVDPPEADGREDGALCLLWTK